MVMRDGEPQPMITSSVPSGIVHGEGMADVRDRRYSWQFWMGIVS